MPAPCSFDGALLLGLVISTCRALHVAVQTNVRTGLSLPPYGWGPDGGLGGTPIDLFQGGAPGKKSTTEHVAHAVRTALKISPPEEQFVNASLIDPVAIMCCPGDQDGMWYYHVSKPAIVPFLVKGPTKNGAAVIVAPGGGFQFLAWHKEGTQIAAWLNSLGYHAFVLKYRVPGSIMASLKSAMDDGKNPNKRFTGKALFDGQRAIRWVRHHAEEYGINPKRIGMIGFSAGGILTAELSYTTDSRYTYEDQKGEGKIEANNYSPRPDFVMIIYSSGTPGNVQKPMPPTFLASAENDQCISAAKVEAYAAAIQEVGGNPELHLFAEGNHGYGDCTMYISSWKYHDVCSWPANAEIFLEQVAGKLGDG